VDSLPVDVDGRQQTASAVASTKKTNALVD